MLHERKVYTLMYEAPSYSISWKCLQRKFTNRSKLLYTLNGNETFSSVDFAIITTAAKMIYECELKFPALFSFEQN